MRHAYRQKHIKGILEREAADTADLVARLGAFDRAGRNRRMPAVVAIEIAQHVPDRAGGRVKDRAFDDMRHASLRRRA